MKRLPFVLVAVLCGAATAETLVGEFSGTLDTTFVFGVSHQEYLAEVGAEHGDLVYGSFAYESDAAEIPIEDITFNADFRGASFYKADYLRVQLGDVLLENNDINVMTATGTAAEFEVFRIVPDRAIPSKEDRKVTFGMFPGDFGESPIFTNNLPQSTEDFNDDVPFDLLLPNGMGLRLSDQSFTLGPACDAFTSGDIDGDGLVAFADFLILSANFGKDVSSHALGDIDCSGDVAFSDFLVLSNNFGQAVSEVSAVPEPATSGLSLAFFLFLHHCFVLRGTL